MSPEDLKPAIAALSPDLRLELIEWLETAVSHERPRVSGQVLDLQLQVLKLPPDDMLDLADWIAEVTFESQPRPVGDALTEVIRRIGDTHQGS